MDTQEASVLELSEKVIRVNPVSKTRKGGKDRSFSILVAVGDHNGHVGVGLGKAKEVSEAIRKGTEAAKKNLITIPMSEGTIPHPQMGLFGAARVFMKPASPGTGVIAGGAVRVILEMGGVKDILTKSLGSSNAVNVAYATIAGLGGLKSAEERARMRGKTVEEIRD